MNFSEASLLNRAISLATYEVLGNANLINEEEKFTMLLAQNAYWNLHKKLLKKKKQHPFLFKEKQGVRQNF